MLDHSGTTETTEPTAWEEIGAVPVRICTSPLSRARTTIPKAIHVMVAELKIRFQHTCGGDAEGFQARVALLAQDLMDAPADRLRQAIVEWVRDHRFLPTAADLIESMRKALEREDQENSRHSRPPSYGNAQELCDHRNASISVDPANRRNIEWAAIEGEPRLRYKPGPRGRSERVNPADVDRVNIALERYGSAIRFDRNGQPFNLPSDHDTAEDVP